MASQPHCLCEIELQFPMFHREMIFLANITQANDPRRGRALQITSLLARIGIERSRNRESHRILRPLRRSPAATAGVAEIAESFQDVLRRYFPLMSRGGAVPAPAATQRKPGRMRPRPAFQSLHWHEIRAGQIDLFSGCKFWDLPLYSMPRSGRL